ncbi:ABC transporter substrate-binding protein [Desulfitobacterium sp. THU1]|uniref:ABC transporter substrate-binding protein n=1 Tax=Desulfitobacterium sp. THU1 TaxID=3138072 RepID=UPI0031202C56
MHKRRLIIRMGILFLIILLSLTGTGCGNQASNTPTDKGQASTDPIKVGLLVPYTGVFTSNGVDITRGVELYLDEVGWKAGGRDIKLIKEDSEMNGQVGLQKTRRLVESEKIDILTGVVSSTVAYAIRDYVVGNELPFIISNAGARNLTRGDASKYIFRVSFANGQYEYPFAKYMYNELKIHKIVVMAPDYAAGLEKAEGFMISFKEAGGEVIQEIYPKLGTTDYGPFLAQVKDADAVFVHFSAADSIKFVKQYDEYGLKRIPLFSAGDLVDESSLPGQGDSALGIISALHYSAALTNPQNQNFVKNYTAKYGDSPNMFAEQGYVSAQVIVKALGAIKGDTSDKEKLLQAIRTVQFDAPRGPFKFDQKTQNVIFDTHIRKVEKVDGKLVNTVIKSIPNTSDYWSGNK